MLSEFAREVAALVLVFVPLDYLLKGETIGPYFWYESAQWSFSLSSCFS
jgi:hypothetical protein